MRRKRVNWPMHIAVIMLLGLACGMFLRAESSQKAMFAQRDATVPSDAICITTAPSDLSSKTEGIDLVLPTNETEPNDPNDWTGTSSMVLILSLYPHVSIHDIMDVIFFDEGDESTIKYDPNSNTLTLDGITAEQALKRFFYFASKICDPNEHLMSAGIVTEKQVCPVCLLPNFDPNDGCIAAFAHLASNVMTLEYPQREEEKDECLIRWDDEPCYCDGDISTCLVIGAELRDPFHRLIRAEVQKVLGEKQQTIGD